MGLYTEKLRGKKVVIVGGSSGIGRAVAHGALDFGAEVVVVASRQESCDTAVKKLEADADAKGRVSGEVLDLKAGSLTDMGNSIETLLTKIGKIDHFIHTAGDGLYSTSVEDIDLEKAQDAYRIRHFAPMAAAKALAKHSLIKDGGSIILTSGSAYLKPMPGWTVSSALLGASVAMTKALAVNMAPTRVNIVTPGPVKTEMWNALSDNPEQMMEEFGKTCLTGRVAEASDTAEAYLYAMRDASLTGEEIVCDCGGRYK